MVIDRPSTCSKRVLDDGEAFCEAGGWLKGCCCCCDDIPELTEEEAVIPCEDEPEVRGVSGGEFGGASAPTVKDARLVLFREGGAGTK